MKVNCVLFSKDEVSHRILPFLSVDRPHTQIQFLQVIASTTLTRLDIGHNKITEIPAGISGMSRCAQAEYSFASMFVMSFGSISAVCENCG